MLDDDRYQFPLVRSFGNQFLELVDDYTGIGFVFKVSDPGLSLRMVASGPEKEHYRTCGWIAYLHQESGRVERLGYDRNSSPYCGPFHRLEVYGASSILYLPSSCLLLTTYRLLNNV